MSTDIHPSAHVSAKAELGVGVRVGPGAVIEDSVVIGDGTSIGAHAVIMSWTSLGRDNRVSPHVVLGGEAQDLGYKGEETHLIIGDGNVFREFSTVHRGTKASRSETRLGDNCMLMNYTHVGHDCIVGNNVIMANYSALGGHVVVEDNVIFGGAALVHQYCRVGRYAFVAGMSGSARDVPPFCIADERRTRLRGLNLVGLKRSGMSAERIRALKEAYKMLFVTKADSFRERLAALSAHRLAAQPDVAVLLDFIHSSERGICQ